MIVPHRQLSTAALDGVIEEYVTRDGTEHSDAADKAEAVRHALDAGELLLVYDRETESCNILPADEARAAAPETERAAPDDLMNDER